MADETTPDGRTAYYAKEQVRILKVKLAAFRESLRLCAIPSRRVWIQGRIDELALALYDRTGTWY